MARPTNLEPTANGAGQEANWRRKAAERVNYLLGLVEQLRDEIGGDTGGRGTAQVITAPASIALGGQRAVVVGTDGQAAYAQPTVNARMTIGVTQGAAAEGATATVQIDGVMTDPSFSWSGTEPVWLKTDGQLTQVRPFTGALFQVGTPVGANGLRIEPHLYGVLAGS